MLFLSFGFFFAKREISQAISGSKPHWFLFFSIFWFTLENPRRSPCTPCLEATPPGAWNLPMAFPRLKVAEIHGKQHPWKMGSPCLTRFFLVIPPHKQSSKKNGGWAGFEKYEVYYHHHAGVRVYNMLNDFLVTLSRIIHGTGRFTIYLPTWIVDFYRINGSVNIPVPWMRHGYNFVHSNQAPEKIQKMTQEIPFFPRPIIFQDIHSLFCPGSNLNLRIREYVLCKWGERARPESLKKNNARSIETWHILG